MQITITFDTNPLKRFAGRLRRSRIFVGVSALVLLGLSSYAYAISTTPTNVFVQGEATSAADINTNFSELYTAASTNETDIGVLQSDVQALETQVASACFWKYQFHTASASGTTLCPANTFAISGSCGSVSGSIRNSRPESIGGGAAEPAGGATGWTCNQTGTGGLDVRALCCPL